VRSFDEAVRWVERNHFPEFVSFDNDLGEPSKEGWQFAQWLIDRDLDHATMPAAFGFTVHSQNPVRRQDIEARLNNYLEFKQGRQRLYDQNVDNPIAGSARLPHKCGDEPLLETAHRQSLRNRPLLSSGGACGCFYCLKTFDASEVVRWVHDDWTALCPRCGIDAVLSSKVCSITPAFLHSMHAHWFKRTVRIDLSAELRSIMTDQCPSSRPTSAIQRTRPTKRME
jgi:hypothetical protein